MGFRPKNERHAIDGAAMIVGLRRPLDKIGMDAVAAAHENWIAELPSLAHEIGLQQVEGGPPRPAPALAFSAFKRDGSVDWQLRVQPREIVVLCRNYTRWGAVWLLARRLFVKIFETTQLKFEDIASCTVEYANEFIWHGESPSNPRTLLRIDSGLISDEVLNHGSIFHIHQGWFRTTDLRFGEKLLERIHVDTLPGASGRDLAKINVTVAVYLPSAQSPGEASEKFESRISEIFSYLHDNEKDLLAKVITSDVQDRIALHAPDVAPTPNR